MPKKLFIKSSWSQNLMLFIYFSKINKQPFAQHLSCPVLCGIFRRLLTERLNNKKAFDLHAYWFSANLHNFKNRKQHMRTCQPCLPLICSHALHLLSAFLKSKSMCMAIIVAEMSSLLSVSWPAIRSLLGCAKEKINNRKRERETYSHSRSWPHTEL